MFKYSIGPALCLALGITTAGQPARAGGSDIVTQSKTVSYADLDLSQAAGAQTLLARIHGAAKWVCGPAEGHEDLQDVTSYRTCIKLAEDRAVADVNRPTVTAMYKGGVKPVRLASRGGEG
jgi:UrcA family protein